MTPIKVRCESIPPSEQNPLGTLCCRYDVLSKSTTSLCVDNEGPCPLHCFFFSFSAAFSTTSTTAYLSTSVQVLVRKGSY